MPPFEVNWLAVIAAVVAMQVLGFLWYGPLFGKVWMGAMGKSPQDMSGPGPAIAIAMVANLVSAIVLAWFLAGATAPDLVTGLTYGLVVAIGFVIPTSLVKYAYENRNTTTELLYVAFNLVGFAIMGMILGAWR